MCIHALATSTGYVGRRPLRWLACNVARALIYDSVGKIPDQYLQPIGECRIGNFVSAKGVSLPKLPKSKQRSQKRQRRSKTSKTFSWKCCCGNAWKCCIRFMSRRTRTYFTVRSTYVGSFVGFEQSATATYLRTSCA